MVMESLVPSPTLIFNLVREITNAIKIAGENTKECDEIRGRVEIVGMYVEEVKANPAVLQNERMKKALSHTEDVLRHALKTITNQEKANAAKRGSVLVVHDRTNTQRPSSCTETRNGPCPETFSTRTFTFTGDRNGPWY